MNESTSQRKHSGRLFDFLAIVIVAWILLGLAWQVGRVTSRTPGPRTAPPLNEIDQLVDETDLQLRLPLERFGMEMTREAVPGTADLAMAHLEEQCRQVLTEADSWVLSLAVSEQELAVLEQIKAATPLETRISPGEVRYSTYRVNSPTGRACVREYAGRSGEADSSARRLLCWGFILGAGTDSQTVWFVRPREKLPGAGTRVYSPAPAHRD